MNARWSLALSCSWLVLGCTPQGEATEGSGGGSTDGGGASGSDVDPSAADGPATASGGPSSGAGTSGDGGSAGGSESGDGGSSGADATSSSTSTGDGGSDDAATETSNPDAPGPVEALTAAPADGAVFLQWTPPVDPDYAGVVLLRQPDAPVVEGPDDGAQMQIGETIGEAEVIFVGEGDQRLDLPLVNGTEYHYRVYAFDADHNYSIGAPAAATPRPALPAGVDALDLDLGPTVLGAKAMRTADGTLHVGILASEAGSLEIHYGRCDAPCTDPADWSTVLVDEDASDMVPAISLDADGRPWLAYRAWDPDDGTLVRAATCVAGCDATVSWSVVPIGTNGGGGGAAILLAHDPEGRAMLLTNQPMVMHSCEGTCSVAANWTHETIAGDWHALGELVIADDGRMTLTSSTYVAQYQGQYRTCEAGCDGAAGWALGLQWNMGGNSGPLPQVRFGPGASQWAMSSTQLAHCDDCFGEYPGTFFVLSDLEATGNRLRLTPWGQPRLVGFVGNARTWLACDYACDDPQYWEQMTLPAAASSTVVDAWLDDADLPVILELGSGNLRLYAAS